MNNERTVIIRNIGDCPVGLKDTQGRMYRLAKNAQMRISSSTLLDILDYPGSRVIFNLGYIQVGNITPDELYNMGLTEEEIEQFLDKESVPTIVITEDLEAEEDEEVIIVEEPVQEEIKEEPKEERLVVKKAQPTNAPKKPTNKKSTKKTASRK
jgi:hypothetical protein